MVCCTLNGGAGTNCPYIVAVAIAKDPLPFVIIGLLPGLALNTHNGFDTAFFAVELVKEGNDGFRIVAGIGQYQSTRSNSGSQRIGALGKRSQCDIIVVIVTSNGQECAGIKEGA